MATHLLVEVCLVPRQLHLNQLLPPLRKVNDGGAVDGAALGATQQDGTQQQLELLEALQAPNTTTSSIMDMACVETGRWSCLALCRP
jgi:hypothetical protein